MLQDDPSLYNKDIPSKTQMRVDVIGDVNLADVPVVENTFKAVKTTLGTTAKQIELPEGADVVRLIHRSDLTAYLGSDETITTSDGFPFVKNEPMILELKKGNNNNLFGIASSSLDIWAVAMVKE